jgi:hypothetical protein
MYILMLVALLNITTVKSETIAVYPDAESCLEKAAHFNGVSEWVKTEEARGLGAAFVCMKVLYPN